VEFFFFFPEEVDATRRHPLFFLAFTLPEALVFCRLSFEAEGFPALRGDGQSSRKPSRPLKRQASSLRAGLLVDDCISMA